jgi:NADPH-dependent 2,4-dienoyl-CoA reductase/sulfur reductase-like enzyme
MGRSVNGHQENPNRWEAFLRFGGQQNSLCGATIRRGRAPVLALAIARRGRGVWDTFRRMDMQTRCVIVSGGPAGVMLDLLLARAGAAVVVLEKHADFRRDFRGDSIHPATVQVMHELGFVDEFRSLLQNEITTLDVVIGNRRFTP